MGENLTQNLVGLVRGGLSHVLHQKVRSVTKSLKIRSIYFLSLKNISIPPSKLPINF